MRNERATFEIAVLILLVLVASPGVFAADYTVLDLGTLRGGSGVPYAVNGSGVVVGGSGRAHGGNLEAFLWSPVGGIRSLHGGPAQDYSEAFGINDAGQVVGAYNSLTSLCAFVWTVGAGIQDLGALPGDNGSKAVSINNARQIVGFSTGPQGVHAVTWDAARKITDLGTLPGGDHSEATALNNNGDVVGFSSGPESPGEAFLWTAATGMRGLGQLGVSTQAHAVNDTRQVVGTAVLATGMRAFFWSEQTGILQLGMLPGGVDYSEAFGINNAEQVVGTTDSSLGVRAFIWTRANGMRDLNTLIPPASNLILISAVAINEAGQIIAIGSRNHDLANDRLVEFEHGAHAGLTKVFLLTPTRNR